MPAGGFEIFQPLAGGRGEGAIVIGEARVELGRAHRHDGVQRVDLAIERGFQIIRMRANALDDAIAIARNEPIEALQLHVELI